MIGKLLKYLLNFAKRTVLIKMLAIDGGDDSDHRGKQEERPVALVGLDNDEIALAHLRVRAGVVHPTAYNKRGIETRSGENRSHHRSGGGLAVRPGHSDALFEAHQLGQHFSARNDGDLLLVRLDNLNVVRGNSGRDDHNLSAAHVFGAMPFIKRRAKLAKMFGHGCGSQIRARYGVAAREQDFGNAAHAAAADAHQVNPLKISKRHIHCTAAPARPSSRSTMSSI